MLKITEEDGFRYYEKGKGDVLLLLHGLFGALSNFKDVIEHFSKKMKVCIPLLPLYNLPTADTTVEGLVNYTTQFIRHKKYKSLILLGNSLGGHIALMYTLQQPKNVKAIVLTGSSGLFENALGDSYPKKSDYAFVKQKTEYTFYDPAVATKELVDEVYEIVNNRDKALRILYLAKSALRNNLKEHLSKINVPVMLIWGKDDKITPPFVAEDFRELLPNAELHMIDKCGHAAMMERAKEFNLILEQFLSNLSKK
jgi:pimeloyl-ACP methyl ester carboxylesterase